MRIATKIIPVQMNEEDYLVRVFSGTNDIYLMDHLRKRSGIIIVEGGKIFYDKSRHSANSDNVVYVTDSLEAATLWAVQSSRERDNNPTPVILEGIVKRSDFGMEKLHVGVALPVERVYIPEGEKWKEPDRQYQREWEITSYKEYSAV